MTTRVEEPVAVNETTNQVRGGRPSSAMDPTVADHVLRSVQDGRKALKRATLALAFSIISATGAWTNFTVTAIRALSHH